MGIPDDYVPIKDMLYIILSQTWDYLPVRFQALLQVTGILSLLLGAMVVLGFILTYMEPEFEKANQKNINTSSVQSPSRVSRKRTNPEVYMEEINPNLMD